MKTVLTLLTILGVIFSTLGSETVMAMTMSTGDEAMEDVTHCLICTEEEKIAGKCETPGLSQTDENQPATEDREGETAASASDQSNCDCDMKTNDQDQVVAVSTSISSKKTYNGFVSAFVAILINNNPNKNLFSNLTLGRSLPAQYLAQLSTVQQLR